jgi:succinate dehydrogenase/fumarate reductase cytochrome b subunit
MMIARTARGFSGLRMRRPFSAPSYSDVMDKTGRPMSPSLFIYKFPVAALSSITTRITGVLLTVGTSAIGIAALGGADVPGLMSAFQGAVPALVPVAKFTVAFPLTYHWASALRHTVRPRAPARASLARRRAAAARRSRARARSADRRAGFIAQYWDMTVKGLHIKTVRTTSLALYAGATAASLVLAAI